MNELSNLTFLFRYRTGNTAAQRSINVLNLTFTESVKLYVILIVNNTARAHFSKF